MVSTLDAVYTWTNKPNKKSKVYYYLLENGLGERRCDCDASDYDSRVQARQHTYYLEYIKPWLKGRYDPGIPSYESIKTKEFKDALAGKVT